MFKKNKLILEFNEKNTRLIGIKNKNKIDFIKMINLGVKHPKDILKKELKKEILEKGYKNANTIVILNIDDPIIRVRELPKTDKKTLKNLIDIEIEQLLNNNLKDYLIKYKIISEKKNNNGAFYEILLIAIKKEILEFILSVAKDGKLKIKNTNIYTNILSETVKKENISNEENIMIADIRDNKMNVTMFKSENYFANFSFETGINDLIKKYADDMELGYKEAEADFLGKSIENKTPAEKEFEDAFGQEEIDLSVYYNEIISNIIKSLDYYKSREYQAKIDEIILVGDLNRLINFKDILKERIPVNVRTLDLDSKNILKNSITYTLAGGIDYV